MKIVPRNGAVLAEGQEMAHAPVGVLQAAASSLEICPKQG